ncbi:carbohydrate binding domain-containing protein [Carboxylicivirga taeanensis]|uniref:carbohydrate binding domain-containing protein n=1 Tax=Carboxylicivirga taeanensis TaxID=1416875 RepID=UPI003F6E06EC
MMKKNIPLITCFICFSMFMHAQVRITINGTHEKHTISPMIQGHGLVYSHEADSIYEDGRMAQLFKDVGTSFLRWPGGTVVTHYHWNDLNGNGWSDNWDPNYDTANNASPANYMDLDEYINLCNTSEVEPMLGINMSSGMEWNRQNDALNEAVSLIKYCQAKQFDVQYFYLDNETYHNGNLYNKDPDNDGESWSASNYAAQINIYADSIKKYIPDAKLIANWSNKIRTDNGFATLMNIAGDNIDYIDIHWYWRWDEASWELWKSQTPIQFENQWYNGGTYVEEIEYFNNLTSQLNKPHIKIASLEWNLGPGPWQTDAHHTKFKTALMQSEMQMQMMQGGMEVASLWSTQWPGTVDSDDRFLVDPDGGYVPNPTATVFGLYKYALNGKLVESSCNDDNIMLSTVIRNNNSAIVFLLSKKDIDTNVEFTLSGYDILSVKQAVRFKDPGILQNISLWQNNSNYLAAIKANTLTMIEFEIDQLNLIENGDFESGINKWDTWNSVQSGTEAVYGNGSLQLDGNASASQWVQVQPSTSYTLSAFAKVNDPAVKVQLGISDYKYIDIHDTSFALQQLMFTTGTNTDSVKVYYWRPPSAVGKATLDEVVLKETAYILNPSFEQGLHAWNTWQTVIEENTEVAEGLISLKLDGNASAYQWISIKPETSYKVIFKAKVDNPTIPVTCGIQKPDGNNYSTINIDDTNYTTYTLNFTSEAGAEQIKLFFWRPQNSQGGAYLDDLQIIEELSLKCATLVGELNFKHNKVKVWPNPATNQINIDCSDMAESIQVSLLDVSGKQLLKKGVSAINGLVQIDISQIPSGIHLLQLVDSRKQSIQVKLKVE